MAGPSGNAMQAMVAMQMAQHPQGPNIGGPPSGAPPLGPGDGSGGQGPDTAPTGGGIPPNVLQELAQAGRGPNAGDQSAGAQLVALIQKMLPKLKVAHHHNGVFELAGPAQDQFLGSVVAQHHGAKMHSVHNTGKGQRLHVAV